MIKKIAFTLFYIVMAFMAVATLVEKYNGTDYTAEHIYSSWWFLTAWGLLAVTGIVYFFKRKVRNWSLVLLHVSFIVILAGALLTHFFSEQGMLHLRIGETTNTYVIPDAQQGMVQKKLPFSLKLNAFKVHYHNGTEAPSDYTTNFTVMDGSHKEEAQVSMNNIFSYKTIRLYQSSYDEDGKGSILSMNSDPFGIPVTYCGYICLFIALIWMLIDPKGEYRRLLRSPLWKKGLVLLVLFLGFAGTTNAANAVPKPSAESFGKLFVLYNNRICPVQTLAIDFTKKLYGEASYKDYSAEQVLLSWVFYGNDWDQEPIIKVKSRALRDEFNLSEYASVSSFFNRLQGGYILGPLVQDYYNGNQDALHKAAADIDDKLQLVMSLRRGTLLQIFPYTTGTQTKWYSPTSKLPGNIEKLHRMFIQNIFTMLFQNVQTGNYGQFDMLLGKMLIYQQKNAGNSLPSEASVKAERMYNAFPYTKVLFIINLAVGFLTFFYTVYRLLRKSDRTETLQDRRVTYGSLTIMVLSFLTLTFCLVLRWIISGKVPMGNGYETMLMLSWCVQLISFFVYRKIPFMLSFGFLLSGFFLLVSFIGQMDPQITPLMPVLSSPLLSVHVSMIMMSFALLSFTFLCGITALILMMVSGSRNIRVQEQQAALHLVSRLFLFPALTLLGIGIFVGAIWANISWGRYWSWDPKEVWALITFMFYAAVVHTQSLPLFRKPLNYHIYVTLSFLMVLMTYFGVNYFLGGMHSYAG